MLKTLSSCMYYLALAVGITSLQGESKPAWAQVYCYLDRRHSPSRPGHPAAIKL